MSQDSKFIIETEAAPEAIGPYSQADGFDGLLFLSGQIGLDPETGELVDGGVEAQVTQIMANLAAVLEGSGLNLSHVLRTTIYVKDMDDYDTVNEVYGRYFDRTPPARATVEVSELPREASVEIDMIAARPAVEEPDESGDQATDADDDQG
jgi:2-iminobutanoate/2-iminopropanoate deaminase